MGNLYGIVVNTLDWDIVVSEFKLQLYYYIYFHTNALGKGMNLFIPPAMS